MMTALLSNHAGKPNHVIGSLWYTKSIGPLIFVVNYLNKSVIRGTIALFNIPKDTKILA